jgi:hypothetical protein
MLAIRHRDQGGHDMAKKRKGAAKKSARKSSWKPAKASGYSADTTVNALVILVVIILAIAGTYMYLQKAKAEPALIAVSPAVVSIAPK